MDIQSFTIDPPAAPTLNQLIDLVDTTKWAAPTGAAQGGGWKVVSLMGISRIIVTFLSVNQASQALGLVGYGSNDLGVNWNQIQAGNTVNITASAVQAFDFLVDPYDDVRIAYQAGTAPTTWRLDIRAIVGQRTVGT